MGSCSGALVPQVLPESAKQCLAALVPMPVHSKCCLVNRMQKALHLLTGDTDPTIACLDGGLRHQLSVARTVTWCGNVSGMGPRWSVRRSHRG